MKISTPGTNQIEVWPGPDSVVLFSYGIPVAAIYKGKFYQTEEYYGPTTKKHINKSQDWFDQLLNVQFNMEVPA